MEKDERIHFICQTSFSLSHRGIKERAVRSWVHVQMGIGCVVKWSQLNFDSHMNDKSTYCVILQCVTKLYLLIREVLKQKKMEC